MQYISLPVTAFEQNCSILWCETTKECAFIDPGGDIDDLIAAVEQRGLKPTGIFLTHGHLDHVGGVAALANHYRIPIAGPHIADKYWIEALPTQAQHFGLPHSGTFEPEYWLQHNDTLRVGKHTLEVRHTPGHTPGHIVLFQAETAVVFVGDVLFRGSVGRTDFPGGNHAQLMQSIKEQLWTLGDNVTVVPGHGPNTTIGTERRDNPYIR